MELKNIVLHHIIREENNSPKLNTSDNLLNSKNSVVIEFVEKLIKGFGSRNPTYGCFHEDEDVYPFQKLLKYYLEDNDFLSFSLESMNLLEKEIQVPQAKGGYVVFIHYKQNGSEFLITIMLDKSDQFVIDDDNLDIEKLKALDIQKLARANRVNLTKWETNSDLYLSFIKGTREVSSYFQKFIGNTDLTSSKQNSQNLRNAILLFSIEKKFNEEKKIRVNNRVNEYLEKQYQQDNDVNLNSISAIISPESPDEFIDFVQSNDEIEVSGNFRLAKKADFSMFYRSKVSGSGFKLEFEKNLIRTGKIIRDGNDVIIKNLPEDLLDKEFQQ